MIPDIPPLPLQTGIAPTQSREALRETAVQFEASFLAEMLKSAGLGQAPSVFGGGSGEDQFSSFLVREQAEQMARAGGIGLAETIYEALKDQIDD